VADASQINNQIWNSGSRKRSRSETPPTASSSKPSRRRGNEAEHPGLESPVPPPAYRPSTSEPIGSNVLPPSPPHSSKPLFALPEIPDSRTALGVCGGVASVCAGNNSTEPNASHSQPGGREPGLEPSYTSPDPSWMFREFDSIPPCCIGCTEHPLTRPMSEQMSPHSPARPGSEQQSRHSSARPASEQASPPTRTENPPVPNTPCGCAAEVELLKSQMVEQGRKIELIVKLLSLQRQAEKTWSAVRACSTILFQITDTLTVANYDR